jgi:hypothetical protein
MIQLNRVIESFCSPAQAGVQTKTKRRRFTALNVWDWAPAFAGEQPNQQSHDCQN